MCYPNVCCCPSVKNTTLSHLSSRNPKPSVESLKVCFGSKYRILPSRRKQRHTTPCLFWMLRKKKKHYTAPQNMQRTKTQYVPNRSQGCGREAIAFFLVSLQLTKSLTSGSHVFDQEIACSLLEFLFQIF